jgi:hypothetical protein
MLDRFRRLFGGKNEPTSAPPPEAPFEYLIVRGEDVAEEMRRAENRSRIVPVFMGTRKAFENAVELIDLNPVGADEIKRAGLELNVEEWIKTRVAEEPEVYEVEETETGTPEVVPAFSPARDILSGEFEREVFIGLRNEAAPLTSPRAESNPICQTFSLRVL